MIGKTISHYKILEELGRGGMGVVYKAQDLTLDRFVAIKFLPQHLSTDEEATQRFIHEAKAASALNHPNIGVVHEIGRTDDGHTFMVMAHYEGESLRDRIDRGSITVDEALDITGQIAAGLAKAHGREIVHRDMKPSNVLLSEDGHAVIIDFGLAKLSGKTRLTKEGSTLGTAAFMSPEQAQGMEVDHRSDIFSVGTMLYEMLTGELPFKGEHEAALLYGVVHETPEPVSAVMPGLPQELDLLIHRCLAKDRSERYQTAEELLADLGKLKQGSAEGIGIARSWDARRAAGKLRYMLRWGFPLVILAAIVIVYKIWAPGKKPEETTPLRPDWILVAEFDGPRDDPDLAAAVRELVTVTLNESRIVRPLSRSDLRQGLALAMKPDTTRIAGEIAQQLAYRAGARIYIEGMINRVGSSYAIVLNVIDSETGSYVFPVSGTAENEDAIIQAIDQLNRELRARLGENEAAIKATMSALDIITPSFDALRKYVQALELVHTGKPITSIRVLREALELDQNFASAWTAIALNFANMGYVDSALFAYQEALARSERLTEKGRLMVEADLATLSLDTNKATELYNSLASRYDTYFTGYGIAIAGVGQPEEALKAVVASIEKAPFGANDIQLYNIVVLLTALGRFQEANEYLPRFQQRWVESYLELLIASAKSEWARADSIAENGQFRLRSRKKYLASRDAARGSIRKMHDHYEGMWDSEFLNFNYHTCFWTLLLSEITGVGEVYYCYPACKDSTMHGLFVQSLEAATRGDASAALDILDHIRQMPDLVQKGHKPSIAFIESWLEATNGNWDQIAQRLEPFAKMGPPNQVSGFTNLQYRWLIADAYEKQGELEKAAEYFELVLDPDLLAGTIDYLVRASYCTYAHQRLILIYSRLGRPAEAGRHWEAFQELFTDPDPELEPMLAEARAAIARLNEHP
jgi:tetratricopeptide (TPR) repeat protein